MTLAEYMALYPRLKLSEDIDYHWTIELLIRDAVDCVDNLDCTELYNWIVSIRGTIPVEEIVELFEEQGVSVKK